MFNPVLFAREGVEPLQTPTATLQNRSGLLHRPGL
jgi:hypothetical protein